MLHSLKKFLRRSQRSAPLQALELYEQGARLADAGKHKKAIQKFSAAIKLSPQAGKLFHHRGRSFAETGSFDAAVFDYDTAVRLDPAYPDTYLDRGNVRHAMGETEKAVRDYSEAIRLNPGWAEAYANRAVANAELHCDEASAGDAAKARSLGVDGDLLQQMIEAAQESAGE